MLTAFAICYYFSEVVLTHPFTEIINFICLVVFAAILDYGLWTLGES
jgi:hypothetical protein